MWALVTDLFLRVKIEAMARSGRRALTAFPSADALLARLDEGKPALVLVDLGAQGDQGFALLERMGGRAPTLAFFSHVDEAAKQRAIALGATRVVPRSALVARFATLLDEVGAGA